MIIGSISENKEIEKRISITPDIAKKYISNGFEILIEEGFASHINISDTEFNKLVKFGKNVLIGKNVKIGKNCLIGHNTIIEKNVIIGSNCSIGSNVIISDSFVSLDLG